MKDSVTPSPTDKCDLCHANYREHLGVTDVCPPTVGCDADPSKVFTPKATPSKEAKHTTPYNFDKNAVENAKLYAYVLKDGIESFNQDRYDSFMAGVKCKVVAFDSMKEIYERAAQEVEDLRKESQSLQKTNIERANIILEGNTERDQLREENKKAVDYGLEVSKTALELRERNRVLEELLRDILEGGFNPYINDMAEVEIKDRITASLSSNESKTPTEPK